MKYPQSFKDKCKRVFPDWYDLHKLVEDGHSIVGRYLDDSSNSSISAKTVMAAKSLDELKDLARKEIEKAELYSEWWELCKK